MSEAGLDLQEQALPSAARLAAEAAFAKPTFSVIRNGQTLITVRRAKGLALVDRPTEVGLPTPQQPASRGPRVFRIDSSRGHESGSTERAQQQKPGQATDAQPLPPKARRHRAPEQRPGPVVLVVHKPAAAPSSTASATIPSQPRSKSLAARLNRVTAILAEIEKAQSFQTVDGAFEARWQGLSLRAAALLNQIRSR